MTISPEMLERLRQRYANPLDPKEQIIDNTIDAIVAHLTLSVEEMQSFRVSARELATYLGQGYDANDLAKMALSILNRNELTSRKGDQLYRSVFATANILHQINSGEEMMQVRGRPVRGGVSRGEPSVANIEGYHLLED